MIIKQNIKNKAYTDNFKIIKIKGLFKHYFK